MFRETSACPVFLLVSVSACETSHASLMKPVSRSTLKQVSASTVCTASQSLKPATGSRRNWFRGVRWTRYSAALPPHRNQRKTSHRNQQPTHNETSNTPHRDSPIPRSETSDTDLKHSRSTTFETSEKPHPKPATNPTPKPAHNPRQRPKRNQRNYNVHSAKAKAKSKADQTHPWRGALPGRFAPSKPYPARLHGAARAPTTSRQETAKNPAAPCPARGGSGGSIFEGQPFVGSIGQTLALVLARGSLDLLKPARPSP